MKIYKDLREEDWEKLAERPLINYKELSYRVEKVLEQVRCFKDQALYDLTSEFDGVSLSSIIVTSEEMLAGRSIDDSLKSAIIQASKNITLFHESQAQQTSVIETMPGVRCWRKSVAIEKVGLYIPAGNAPLFSTVLMLGIPAKLAGCHQIELCTPPQKDGTIHPAILFAAELIGITRIFKVGGIQAIGAMAYGTETIAKVNKIFGPGNRYVTAAKQVVSQQGVAIDIPAGPSEVLIVADANASPNYIAADLIAQAEHGPDTQCILVCTSEELITKVHKELLIQVQKTPRRELVEKALKTCRLILASDMKQAIDFSNFFAPEHLIIMSQDPITDSHRVFNAGSVFLGAYTPVAAGDYASGTNHTLPTNGGAKAFSGVSLDSFVKKITFQTISNEGLLLVGPIVEKMAQAEQLYAHSDAVSIRLNTLKK